VITGEERYNKVVDIWSKTNENLTNVMMETGSQPGMGSTLST
jgi:DNA-directed RNA polymerase beta' subunit